MKKILFGLMSLMIGICLISASYAISQENDAVGGILPPDGLHIMHDNSNNMQADPIAILQIMQKMKFNTLKT